MAPSVPLGSTQQASRVDLAHQPGYHREQKKPFKTEIKSLPLECVCMCLSKNSYQRNCLNFAYCINYSSELPNNVKDNKVSRLYVV